MKRTKAPWVFIDDHIRAPEALSTSDQMGDYRGVIICDMSAGHGGRLHAMSESKANAQFIVKACNSHDDLLEALKELQGTDWNISSDWIAQAKKAIEKATQ